MIGFTLFVLTLSLLYYFAIRPHNYWSKRNVKTNKFIPIFGDYYRMILGKESIGEMIQRCYHEAKNLRYVGCYLFQFPALMITSPELVKKVCVKNFDHFMNHKNVIPDGIDDFLTKNLVTLKGENWKNMRSILSPSFTSSKMKAITENILLFDVVPLILQRPYNYWSKRNVKTNKFIPFFGDYYRMILGKESIGEMIQRSYHEAKNLRYFGCYLFQFPALMITSPELVKKVCVKNFDHFTDHKNIIPDGIDELWTKNLVSLKGENWKNMRSILSPSFTSSKMKAMFVHISENANLFAQHFLKMDEETVTVEFKDAFTRYTTDVIASAAFGVKVDCLKDRDNEFYVMGKKGSNFTSSWGISVFTAYQILPSIAKFFRLRLFEENIQSFFLNLNSKLELSDSDIASQVFIFFLGGYETVSTAMCLMAYELAVNPDVQKKLYEEIIENRKDNDELLYETISNMTYLDMVVSECLRKWPVGAFTDRVVTKPYTIEPEVAGEKTLTLDVDQYVIIPTIAFHHDPKYYEHPEKLHT
ncbi:hypothetical protein WA026_003283 [Henosepilachna vigintioctopunctata]|uniref:Cytochrome P450 n=1 Tax=Henosepilachna vigintioctopunctata TaxID=420089 RepID=A0AAW1TMN1_9CUCU